MKKILLTAVSVVLVAALAIAGTLAFFTDRTAANNVFTVGNVDIELNEDFAQGSQLVPGVDVEKNVTVTNTGKNDAWVWVKIEVPAALKNAIALKGVSADWKAVDSVYMLKAPLAAGATTSSVLEAVGFASNVDVTPEGDLYLVNDGNTVALGWNISETPVIKVSAYAIQTENFASVEDAYAAYGDQWGTNDNATAETPAVTEVATADEFKAAVAKGGVVVLTQDVALDAVVGADGKATHYVTVAKGTSTTVNLNGHNIDMTAAPTANGNYSVFQAKGDLAIVGEGAVTVAHTGTDMGWGALSSVVSVEGGSVTVAEGVVLEHKGGTAMAYGIDVNTTLGTSTANIDGAIIKSSYIGVRIFNNHKTQQGIVNVNSGAVDGTKRDIWVHNPSASAVDANGVVNFASDYVYTTTVQDASSFYGRIYDFTNQTVVTTTAELKTAVKAKNATVVVTPGTYDMGGKFSIAEGATIVGGEGVVFNGTLTNTIKNVTVKDVEFVGGNAHRWGYAAGDVVFENCTFDATSIYAIHYDGTSGANITYKNCDITGWVAITGGHNSLTFDGCTIKGNGAYGVIRTYGDATIKNCTFDVANVNTTDVYQDGIHAVDCTITVENCTNVNGNIEDIFNVSGTGVITVK